MPISMNLNDQHCLATLHCSGIATKDDYDKCMPELLDFVQQHGKIRCLMILDDFQGWTTGGLWEELKFDSAHMKDIERCAIVGDAGWVEKITEFFENIMPMQGEIKFFSEEESSEAEDWVTEPVIAHT